MFEREDPEDEDPKRARARVFERRYRPERRAFFGFLKAPSARARIEVGEGSLTHFSFPEGNASPTKIVQTMSENVMRKQDCPEIVHCPNVTNSTKDDFASPSGRLSRLAETQTKTLI